MPGVSYRFGPFLVDRGRYHVTRDGQPVSLTPKLLDLLLYLLERPAVLVSKDELLDAVWPGANVTENALTQAVSELRQVLGDNAGAPRYIKTIARRGYRLVADVTQTVDAPLHAPTPEPSPAVPSVATDLQTIVVRDFENVATDAEYAWLSAGIAETVTGDLRALGRFKVVDRWRVVEATRRTDGSLDQVAGAVHAQMAVVGSFQRSAERIRIMARVVDVASGEALADAKADGQLAQIFDLQDQIVAGFARDLRLALPQKGGSSSAPRETQRLDAYRAFTEGWVRLESFDVRELSRASADFERAVSLDHRYAAAYTGLANAEVASYETTRFEIEPATHVLERAIAHARQAVALDETLAEAHGALALALGSAWRTAEAIVAAQRAIALEPVNWRHLFRLCRASWGDARLAAGRRTLALFPEFALSYFQMAMLHIARGQLADAEALLRMGSSVQDQQIARGERLPGRGLHWLLGMTRFAQGDVRDAIGEFDRELSMADPNHLHGREFAVRSHLGRALALLAAGAPEQAETACRRALDLYAAHPESHLGRALALSALGSRDEAAEEIAKTEDSVSVLARTRPAEASAILAAVRVAQGQLDEAATSLGALLDASHPAAAWTLPIDPFLFPLRDHSAFRTVLDRLSALAH